MLVQSDPQTRTPIGVLMELSDDEIACMLYEKQEIARMDFESMWKGKIKEQNARSAELVARIAELEAQLAKYKDD